MQQNAKFDHPLGRFRGSLLVYGNPIFIHLQAGSIAGSDVVKRQFLLNVLTKTATGRSKLALLPLEGIIGPLLRQRAQEWLQPSRWLWRQEDVTGMYLPPPLCVTVRYIELCRPGYVHTDAGWKD